MRRPSGLKPGIIAARICSDAELELVGMGSNYDINIIELLGLFTDKERNTGTETFHDKDCNIILASLFCNKLRML